MYCVIICLIFFFNDTSTTEIYTLSLHDALPILLAFGPDGQPGIYSTENGERKAIAGMAAGEQPIGWTTDGASIYVYRDRKSIRLNSSHANISYAVFCLKKKKKKKTKQKTAINNQ